MSNARWQLMPDLTPEEYEVLKSDIAAHGVRVAVVVDAETGAIVDGHHRQLAIDELRAAGLKVDYQRDVRRFSSDDERVSFVVGANLFRRHLTKKQRAEVVAKLRAEGWSLRRIGDAVGVDPATALRDLQIVAGATIPERVERKGGGSYPSRRPKLPPSIFVGSDRDETRARTALVALGDDAPGGLRSLARTEERARMANLTRIRAEAAEGPTEHVGETWELRTGDFREVLADIADQSVDAIVTDPPYNNEGVPLYEPLGAFSLRVLKPGRLAAVYAGHLQLDREMELLAKGGLTYMWHGANVLAGRHTKVRVRLVFGAHRSVLLYSAGEYRPRHWLNDLVFAEGRGGPEERPLHPWQQALEPVRHWVRAVSEPGELIVDPFLGSGTTAVAAVMEGRRFIGCDIDPGCVETTRRRLVELGENSVDEAGA